MLVKSCIKRDFHFSFPTRIRSYSGLFWFLLVNRAHGNRHRKHRGQDMTAFQDLLPRAKSHRYCSAISNSRLTLFLFNETALFCVNQKRIPCIQTHAAPVQRFFQEIFPHAVCMYAVKLIATQSLPLCTSMRPRSQLLDLQKHFSNLTGSE